MLPKEGAVNIKDLELPVSELRHTTDPAEFPFQTTADLSLKDEVIGQVRAVKSIEFGLSINNHGYNIFVSGIPGTGRNTIVKSIVRRISLDRPVPDDWCYVNNFKDPDRPLAINLPPGKGREFRRDVDTFIAFMQSEIPKVFESKEYEEQKSRIVEEEEKAKEVLFSEAGQRALELGFQLSITRTGIVKVPLWKGKPLQQQELESLTPEQRLELEEREKKVDVEIRDFLAKARLLDKEAHEKIHDLNRRIAHFAMGHQLEDLKEKYDMNKRIPDYLAEVEEDILSNLREFLGQTPEMPFQIEGMDKAGFLERYKVNVIVDNADTKGGPVVDEANPTYNNLVGRIERKARFGAFYTNFSMIRSGSVLQANGGYLVMNALDVLRNPFSWDALKRIIKKNEVKIEDVAELYGFTTGGIKPEPIPVSLKIIMLGSPWLYYLLYYYDEDFRDIFKVKSDFDTQTASSRAEKMRYANFIGNMVKTEGLLPFDRNAVAAVVDYAVRLTEKKGKLSLRFSDLTDLVREAAYWASQAGGVVVTGEHVDKALDEKVYRANLIDERIQELFTDGTLMVDVAGAVPAQVNGLSVYDIGDFSFGKPSRITARVYLGKGGVLDIEREAKLSGRIYNKGVLILSGFLGGTYAQDKSLSLSASLAFEQSYGEVEGDSASAAELIALISGIAEVPVKQGLAITGSINQKGEMQPIGGVNEKIEGFFAVCRNRGLTGEQGVVIPKINVKNLMLKKDVIEAVREGKFNIYAVTTVDEALEIMTGMPAGNRKADGTYPEGTVNDLVDKKLKEMSKKQKGEEKGEEKKEKKEENNESAPKKTQP
ncbi:MAG TPA: ATP-binding protein [Nitrospirota bacterium]|nr:ATP-binding protein [Nitrospirota bacterium]